MVCPPIELQGDANLTLVVDGTFTVTGGAAGNGANSTDVNPPGGTAGFAGIHVPNGTTLIVRGCGVLKAYGGHAGDGGNGFKGEIGGGGGGGAGAGIGGNGGAGGAGGNGTSGSTDNGSPGGAGISAGDIYLYENITVMAYGGAGGSGAGMPSGATAPGGAGGYPAAGIGGGGAGAGGASHDPGGGGFSGGRGDMGGTNDPTYLSSVVDGSGAPATSGAPGGGYFSAYIGNTWDSLTIVRAALGGGAVKYNYERFGGSQGGNGGSAGNGGTVKKANTATLTVANGSYKTATKEWGKTPTPIYAQSGYDLELLRKADVRVVDAGLTKNGVRSKEELEKELGATGKSSTIKATGLAGVGSGAGYTEASNGTEIRHLVPGR